MRSDEIVGARYVVVDDVDEAIAFYTQLLDFALLTSAAPAFADVGRGKLRLRLAGPTRSAGRPIRHGTNPGAARCKAIHLIVDDLSAQLARLHEAGARLRNDIVERPDGRQVLVRDPSGNVVELFQPARKVSEASDASATT